MIAKLIKTGKDKYHIESDEFDGIHLACYPYDITKQKLSLENCQTIEKGYDLDELSDNESTYHISRSTPDWELHKLGFIRGFKKAIKILGDKQYTKEDMLNAYSHGTNDGVEYESFTESGAFDDFDELEKYEKEQEHEFQNWLERKEWDVFIVMACGKENGCDEDGNCEGCQIEPSLDENGCLQLTQLKFQK